MGLLRDPCDPNAGYEDAENLRTHRVGGDGEALLA